MQKRHQQMHACITSLHFPKPPHSFILRIYMLQARGILKRRGDDEIEALVTITKWTRKLPPSAAWLYKKNASENKTYKNKTIHQKEDWIPWFMLRHHGAFQEPSALAE
ncbi:hypothetical protein ACLOJK_037511 [Asimina triloba]